MPFGLHWKKSSTMDFVGNLMYFPIPFPLDHEKLIRISHRACNMTRKITLKKYNPQLRQVVNSVNIETMMNSEWTGFTVNFNSLQMPFDLSQKTDFKIFYLIFSNYRNFDWKTVDHLLLACNLQLKNRLSWTWKNGYLWEISSAFRCIKPIYQRPIFEFFIRIFPPITLYLYSK